MPEQEKDKSIEEIMDLVNREAALFSKKFSNITTSSNSQLAEALKISPKFKLEIENLRKKHSVPKLFFKKDFDYPVNFGIEEDGGYSYDDSAWLHENEDRINKFDKDIESLCNKFGLPSSFHLWVKLWVLYGIPDLTKNHLDDWGVLDKVTAKNYKNYSFNSEEKRVLIWHVKQILPKFKYSPEKTKKIYRDLCEQIKKLPKNKQRRMRTFETAIQTSRHGEKATFIEPDAGETGELMEIKKKLSYDDIVTEVDVDLKYDGQEKEFAARLRKQNERLRKRFPSLFE